jgi:hypothetical protein
MDGTGRFEMPRLVAGQAQKEITHNEALACIDMLLHPAVETMLLAVPPGAPAIGATWIVAAGADGAWAGKSGLLATWTDGGWRFARPVAGMAIWVADRGVHARWTGTAWTIGPWPTAGIACDGVQVVGTRQPAIAAPTGGATIDNEARTALSAVLNALRNHGLITT